MTWTAIRSFLVSLSTAASATPAPHDANAEMHGHDTVVEIQNSDRTSPISHHEHAEIHLLEVDRATIPAASSTRITASPAGLAAQTRFLTWNKDDCANLTSSDQRACAIPKLRLRQWQTFHSMAPTRIIDAQTSSILTGRTASE